MQDNHQLESDIAMLLMQIEAGEGDAKVIYGQIRDHFEQLRATGDDIPAEFAELEKDLDLRFAA
jgi:hypothetical protein